MTGRGRGVSLIEIVLGVMILGISGVTVLELVRSNTANLQVTEIEVIARGMGADLLERYSSPSVHDFPSEAAATRLTPGVPAKWDIVAEDASMKYVRIQAREDGGVAHAVRRLVHRGHQAARPCHLRPATQDVAAL